jgi:DNA-binding transcriptional regulator YhcF (GntR family)
MQQQAKHVFLIGASGNARMHLYSYTQPCYMINLVSSPFGHASGNRPLNSTDSLFSYRQKNYPVNASADIKRRTCTAKYMQVANCILNEISAGNLHVGNSIPSINELSNELDIARDTVEKGYRHLMKNGIIGAIPRRGYFVRNANVKNPFRILLLVSRLCLQKKAIYDAFVQTIGDCSTIDFCSYNNDVETFRKILSAKKEAYTHFVVQWDFDDAAEEKASEMLKMLPTQNVVLLDRYPAGQSSLPAAYQQYREDIYNALTSIQAELKKYGKMNLLAPADNRVSKDVILGLRNFCRDHNFEFGIINDIRTATLQKGELYIDMSDDDLVVLIEKLRSSAMQIGRDVGVISLNETPLRKILVNGITTISPDFALMGKTAAEFVLSKTASKVRIPFHIMLRPSV